MTLDYRAFPGAVAPPAAEISGPAMVYCAIATDVDIRSLGFEVLSNCIESLVRSSSLVEFRREASFAGRMDRDPTKATHVECR